MGGHDGGGEASMFVRAVVTVVVGVPATTQFALVKVSDPKSSAAQWSGQAQRTEVQESGDGGRAGVRHA